MLKIIRARLKQGHRTVAYPQGEPTMPPQYRGRPEWDAALCKADCAACINACPTGALARQRGKLVIDMGRCIFCADCTDACPTDAIRFTRDFRLAARSRGDLLLDGDEFKIAQALDKQTRRIFGRSLKLRQVSAGGCNACEADINVLTTVVFDLSRFGIKFVASPRHADGLLITGPVTRNMALALKKTYDATPAPKVVIAVGACAISGGMFADLPQSGRGADEMLPVDLYVPGCPPHPLTILDGLLRLLGRME